MTNPKEKITIELPTHLADELRKRAQELAETIDENQADDVPL